MEKVFGIDLGTTYSCVAYVDENGKATVIKNSEDTMTTPSVVYFEDAENITVGESAKENALLEPLKVVSLIKRDMGKADADRTINGVKMRPEQISSYILRKLVNDAMNSLREEGKLGNNEEVKKVVITCPAYFGVEEKEATKTAGEIAGLEVLNIINEPTAAAISYGINVAEGKKNVLVYDLGGGTFDITVMQVNGNNIKAIATGGNHALGGADWDDAVRSHIVQRFEEETGISAGDLMGDPETWQQISLSVEKAKKLLTSKEKAPISVNFEGEKFRMELTREKFDELTMDLLDQTIQLTNDMFEKAAEKGVNKKDIDIILLVGGSSKMKQVEKRICEEYGKETKLFEPDWAVAKGAAIYAQNMNIKIEFEQIIYTIANETGETPETIRQEIETGTATLEGLASRAGIQNNDIITAVTDTSQLIDIGNVSSRTYGVSLLNCKDELKIFNIIMKNSDLPAKGTQNSYCPVDNMKYVKFTVYESLLDEKENKGIWNGEQSDFGFDKELGREIGEARIELPSGTPKGAVVEVTFKLEENGLLTLIAKEKIEGRQVTATFETKNGMSDKAVEQAKAMACAAVVN